MTRPGRETSAGWASPLSLRLRKKKARARSGRHAEGSRQELDAPGARRGGDVRAHASGLWAAACRRCRGAAVGAGPPGPPGAPAEGRRAKNFEHKTIISHNFELLLRLGGERELLAIEERDPVRGLHSARHW